MPSMIRMSSLVFLPKRCNSSQACWSWPRASRAIANPLVNSYKRLVPGYEAPVYIAWSARNRSPLIRVPAARGNSTRVELRSPDPSCNPYLLLALVLRAGLDGIERGLMPPYP